MNAPMHTSVPVQVVPMDFYSPARNVLQPGVFRYSGAARLVGVLVLVLVLVLGRLAIVLVPGRLSRALRVVHATEVATRETNESFHKFGLDV